MTEDNVFRSAFITLVGRPNSGKSSLINNIVGEEISIVSPLPQTTRNIIRGIFTTDKMQLVFIDTPGIHKGKYKVNEMMLKKVTKAIEERSDIICYLVDLSRDFSEEENLCVEIIRGVKKTPIIIIFNKIDIVKTPEIPIGKFYELYPDLKILPSVKLSAISNECKEIFLNAIDKFIPPGPMYFDPEELTDVNMRFIAAEYIRKEIINNTRQEVPHAVFVEIDSYKELPDKDIIEATIHVETNGQKGIIIGKGGSLISKIRENAAAEISKITGKPVTLFCHVKVSPKWRDNQQFLKFVGFDSR